LTEPEEIIFIDVKPSVIYPPTWRVEDLGNRVTFHLPENGVITLEYQQSIAGNGIEWVIEKLTELQNYGFEFRAMAQIDPKDFKVIGDNEEALQMYKDYKDYPFEKDKITVGGFIGNKDCIWKLTGYFTDSKNITDYYDTFKNAKLVKWLDQ